MNVFNKFALMALIALLTLFTACGDSDDNGNNHTHHNAGNNNNAHPLGEAQSVGGHFTVNATHDPATPITGAATVTLTINDAHNNKPLEGLTVTVEPWMPGHGHGSNKTPVVTDQGAGVYDVKDIVYTMAGDWELRIEIKNTEHDDTIVYGVNVK